MPALHLRHAAAAGLEEARSLLLAGLGEQQPPALGQMGWGLVQEAAVARAAEPVATAAEP